MELNKIYQGDVLDVLKTFPDNSINCCITSPPYFGLRDYGMTEQIGLESTPEIFISKLVDVFREVKRVLKDDGTLWVNMGDSYWGGRKHEYLKPRDLVGIPWMLAFALRRDGWYLRQDVIWSKPNPMPESVTNRCTKSHEYIFMLSKRPAYYYDHEAIKTPAKESSIARLSQDIENQAGSARVPGKTNGTMKAVGGDKQRGHSRRHAGFNDRWDNMTTQEQMSMGANKRSVWEVSTKPFSEAHFATYPEDLIVDCIKAGCPVGGTVLDPFSGAGTTMLVSRKLDRNAVGIELNPDYIKISDKRLHNSLGVFR